MEKQTVTMLINNLRKDLANNRYGPYLDLVLLARYRNVMNLVIKALPEHQVFIGYAAKFDSYDNCIPTLREIEVLLGLGEAAAHKIDEGKIFASSEEKIKQAAVSYQNDDTPGVFNNLNTALELMLKDKLQIPTTITNINTSDILNILLSEKLGPLEHLKETQRRLFLDAHTKHRGYIPQSSECVFALKAMEDLKGVLQPMTITLDEKTKNKIYSFVRKPKDQINS